MVVGKSFWKSHSIVCHIGYSSGFQQVCNSKTLSQENTESCSIHENCSVTVHLLFSEQNSRNEQNGFSVNTLQVIQFYLQTKNLPEKWRTAENSSATTAKAAADASSGLDWSVRFCGFSFVFIVHFIYLLDRISLCNYLLVQSIRNQSEREEERGQEKRRKESRRKESRRREEERAGEVYRKRVGKYSERRLKRDGK